MATTNTNESRTKDNRYKSKGNGYKPRDNSYKSNPYSYQKDKDEDSDGSRTKGHKAVVSKTRSVQNKEYDQQPAKLETIKRLEREKKVVRKKNHEEETEKQKRLPVKQKRSVKDWTKGYEYGLLDDEADYSK